MSGSPSTRYALHIETMSQLSEVPRPPRSGARRAAKVFLEPPDASRRPEGRARRVIMNMVYRMRLDSRHPE